MSALELAITAYRKAGHPAARARIYAAELLAVHRAEVLAAGAGQAEKCKADIETSLGTYPCERVTGHGGDCDERTEAEIAEGAGQVGKDTHEGESTRAAVPPYEDMSLPSQLREALRTMAKRGPVVELIGRAITGAESGERS